MYKYKLIVATKMWTFALSQNENLKPDTKFVVSK